jgi:hypothetical protein
MLLLVSCCKSLTCAVQEATDVMNSRRKNVRGFHGPFSNITLFYVIAPIVVFLILSHFPVSLVRLHMAWWALAVLAHPETQSRTSRVDAAVGRSRLPNFAYYHSLPYICATVKEVLGWRAVAPLSVPH